MGVDVAAAGQRLTDEGVCFAVGSGVAGVDSDGPGEGGGGVERGDPDGTYKQAGKGLQPSGHQSSLHCGTSRMTSRAVLIT